MHTPPPKPAATGLTRILNAAAYSKDGLMAAYRHEAAFRQLAVLHTVLLAALSFTEFELAVKMLLIAASFLSLIVELINTAIEATVDRISTERHPLAKIAKDTGSAAQLLALILLALLWLAACCG